MLMKRDGVLRVAMIVEDVDGNVLNQREYNFLNQQHRIKIARTSWWAMHNGHSITTYPLDDDEHIEVINTKPEFKRRQAVRDLS